MALRQILPHALIILLAQAGLAAAPGVVAAREGGMGLGSALIAAQVVAVGGITFGAIMVAGLAGGRTLRIVLVAGALVHYVGLIALGMQPMGALIWIVVALGLAGVGTGTLLAIAFVAVAQMEARTRPAGVVVLLAASLAASVVAPLLAAFPGLALSLVAGAVVAVAVLVARLTTAETAEVLPARIGAPRVGRITGGTIATGVLVSVGVVMVLAGADPSRVTAILLAGALGLPGLDGLDLLRLSMALVGLLLVVGPAVAWSIRYVGPRVRVAVLALSLAGVAVAGTVALTSVPGQATGGLASAFAAAATLVGLGIAGWWLTRSGESRRMMVVGTAVVVAGSGIGLLARGGAPAASPDLGRMLAAGIVAVGGAFAFAALRHVLAAVTVRERTSAAAAGVAAFAFGTMLGTMLGSSARTGWMGSVSEAAVPAGLAVLGAAFLAVVAAWLLPRPVPATDERELGVAGASGR